jgi:hypothetical protein
MSRAPAAAQSEVKHVVLAPSLVTTEDRMIPPEAQRAMSKRAGSTVVEVRGRHSGYVSQPQSVASIIETAAQSVGLLTATK